MICKKIFDARTLPRKAKEQLRIAAVRRVEAGESPENVASGIGINRRQMYRWIEAFHYGGEDALRAKPIRGATPKLNANQMAKLSRMVREKNPLQLKFDYALWTLAIIRELIRREFAVHLSEVSVGRLMRRMGFSPQRPLYKAWQQDPHLVNEWRTKEYPRIVAKAKRENALIFFADESGIRSDYHAGTTWAAVGQTPVVKAPGARFSLNIADIDTGVRFDHPDLRAASLGGRLLPGFDFVSDRSIANDGDGWDSDASDPGDWVTTTEAGSSQFSGCTASGSSWHGTRVAGIIGAVTNNSQGVAGLGWNGWILPVRVLGQCGGHDSDILAGMLWAGGIAVDGVPANPYPARIVNMSLGASGTCPQSYRNVVNQLLARGVLVVASVGNEGSVVDAPANCPGVAGVGALRHAGTKVGFSNLGPSKSRLHLSGASLSR